MELPFLEYLKCFNSPREVLDKDLKWFTERLGEYLSFVRKKERNEIQDIIRVGRELRDLGAPLESYKIIKADAEYYKCIGNDRMFWRQMYFAYVFVIPGYPTKSIEEEVRTFCEKLRRDKEFYPYFPLFLNIYGMILHLYRDDYERANEVYREAVSVIENLSPDRFEDVVKEEYLWAHKLISNNYIDSLLVTKSSEETDKELGRMLDVSTKDLDVTESEDARIATLMNNVELLVRKGEREMADRILDDILSDANEEIKREIKPSYYRIKALMLAHKGDKKGSLDFIIRSLKESEHSGNTLTETLTMRDSLYIYNLLVSRGEVQDPYTFFKEQGLFSYLLKVLEIKDWFLGVEHSEEVRETAVGIAEVLSLDRSTVQLIEISALLHDVGKFIIPLYSLNKISPLDELDWEVIKAHPEESGRILRKLGLNEAAKIAENHHERIDGSGYPKGIRDIGVETEIVAVSDAYNAAVTPNRKYRIPKDPERVLREIKNGEKGGFSLRVIQGLEKYLQTQK